MSSAESGSRQWHMPEHIHPLFHDGGLVYLNSQTGKWGVTNRQVGIAVLEACGMLDSLDLNWRELKEHTLTPPEFLSAVAEVGLIAVGSVHPPLAYKYATPPPDIELFEAGNVLMVRPATEQKPLPWELERDAHQCVKQALELVHGINHGEPFPDLVRTIREARGPDTVPATMRQALEVAGTVRQVSEPYPNKVACLEELLATALLGARLGLAIEAHFGAGVDPIAYHAWLAAEGQPVRLEYDEPILGRYHSVFVI